MKIVIRPGLPPHLVTQRLTLREVGLADISDDLLWWLNDPDTTEYLEIRHTPQTFDAVKAYILERLSHPEMPHFGVYDGGASRLVGTVTVNLYNPFHKTADLSFVIGHPEAQRMGYGTEAVHAVCVYLFEIAGLWKLTGGLYSENHGSRRIFEKNGFTREGIKREQYLTREGRRTDSYIFGLLASEFWLNPDIVGNASLEVVYPPGV